MNADAILAEAKTRLQAIEAEARRLADFVSLFEELARAAAGHDVRTGEQRSQASATEFPPGALADTEAAAVDAIRSAGKALHTRELLPLIQASGIEVGGKDPLSTLSARLSRSSKLTSSRLNGWNIVDNDTSLASAEEGRKTAEALAFRQLTNMTELSSIKALEAEYKSLASKISSTQLAAADISQPFQSTCLTTPSVAGFGQRSTDPTLQARAAAAPFYVPDVKGVK